MNKLVLFNKGKQDSFLLENAIEEHLSCFAESVSTIDQLMTYLNQKTVNLVIMNTKKFGLEELNMLSLVRAQNTNTPIMVVAETNEFPDYFNIEKSGKNHIIYKPFEEQQFIGLSKKLLCTKKAPAQHFRRYRTNQGVDLEILAEGHNMPSKLCNLSLGGAYCEFFIEDEEQSHLTPGDYIRVNIPRSGEGHHSMNAQVVWRKNLKNNDSVGVGLRFVSLQSL